MAFTTITNQEIVGLGVTGLPDTPGLSTEAMQAEFDEYPIFLKDKTEVIGIHKAGSERKKENYGTLINSTTNEK